MPLPLAPTLAVADVGHILQSCTLAARVFHCTLLKQTPHTGVQMLVLSRLYDFMDADGDGDVSHFEFTRVLSAEDIMVMAPI